MPEYKNIHEEAMNYSFLAKQERDSGNEDKAIELYIKAAILESEVADFYLDRGDLEPTRSIIARSAAFLNLKSGNLELAEKYIFWALSNNTDNNIREQFYEALELCLAFRNLPDSQVSHDMGYIYKLRQKSVLYSIEPKMPFYSNAVTLEMVSDFSANYVKSLKAYSKSKYIKRFSTEKVLTESIEEAAEQFQEIINPIITTAGFGSFKFAIAADFLPRLGETIELTKLKSNILIEYHDEIFSKPLDGDNISKFKEQFNEEEIDQIFRPLFNITSKKSEYKIEYYDRESMRKTLISKTGIQQKSQLLPVKKLSSEEIGNLESTLAHKRLNEKGTFSRNVILKQELKSFAFDYATNYIEPKGYEAIILNREIIVSVGFSSEIGFDISYDDLPIESRAIIFHEALDGFYKRFIDLIRLLRDKPDRSAEEESWWHIIVKLINNPFSIT